MTDDIQGEAVEVGSEIIPAPSPQTLFRTDDPVRVLEEAQRVAEALKPVLVARKMTQQIGDKEHVRVEGWQTLGAMLGVVPVVVWSRPIPDTQRSYSREEGYGDKRRTVNGKGSDWEARVEARTLDERVIGAAEAMCTRDEYRWSNADDYAVRSMAQTRATSKALSGPLRFVVTLAGYEATPAEEMPADGAQRDERKASDKARDYAKTLLKKKPEAEHEAYMVKIGITRDRARFLLANEFEGISARDASAVIDVCKSGWRPSLEHPSDVPSDDPPVHEKVEGEQGEIPWEGT
jgi:hypothetical protein